MTEDNRRRNIALEAARGDASLKAAEVLLASGLLADEVASARRFVEAARSALGGGGWV